MGKENQPQLALAGPGSETQPESDLGDTCLSARKGELCAACVDLGLIQAQSDPETGHH